MKKLKETINIWYQIEIKPGIVQYLDKKSLSFKRWRYINNIPSITEIVNEIKENHKTNEDADTYVYHTGIVRSVPPIMLEIGKPVMTKHGVGKIKAVMITDIVSGHTNKVVIEIMTTNYGKSRGYIKYLNLPDITQLVVYHAPTNQFILMSPKDYVYIVDENQEIAYRVTNRKYATLSPDYKANAEHIKIFNEYKGGARVLRQLHAKGYAIVKQ